MSSFTATLLVGEGHPIRGGIVPTHALFLSENSRSIWHLTRLNVLDEAADQIGQYIRWVPTAQNTLEDALLMAGLYILKNPELSALAVKGFRDILNPHIHLHNDVDPGVLEKMYKVCRALDFGYKFSLTVFETSSLHTHLPVLAEYKMDVEVCTPSYSRTFSALENRSIVRGKLKAE